jgi:glucose-6-phosphate 1-dehydrogenase
MPRSAVRPRLSDAEPAVILLVGATGDLARRKVVPALAELAELGRLHPDTRLVGLSRRPMADGELRALHAAAAGGPAGRRLVGRMSAAAADPADPGSWARLAERLGAMGVPNLLVFASTPPSAFPGLVAGLHGAGLSHGGAGWRRIIVEKPFGRDGASAREIAAVIGAAFAPRDVYRMDHYLGKEAVRGLGVLRAANPAIAALLHRRHVAAVHVRAAETIGIEGRGAFYEEAGAIRDMAANHLLSLAASLAAEPGDDAQAERLRVIAAVRPLRPGEVLRGQYAAGRSGGRRVPGYRAEPGVAKDSAVETYLRAELSVENDRWWGVPFTIESGKRLERASVEIVIALRGGHPAAPGRLVVAVSPTPGLRLEVGVKRPGVGLAVAPASLGLDVAAAFGDAGPSAYGVLIDAALRGDGASFLSAGEVEAAWRIVDPVVAALDAGRLPPPLPYPAGSAGPSAPAGSTTGRR